MSNPSFAPGDRRVEDPQKDLPVRVAARAHLGTTALPLVVSHASSQHSEILKTYQVDTRKSVFGVSDHTDQAVQQASENSSLKFLLSGVELYYLCSEHTADLCLCFRTGK